MRHASASRTAVWLVTTVPYQPVLLPSGSIGMMITKICEWIDPAYSADLLAQTYDVLKKRWLLL